jgi:hypothetical protein
MPAKLLFVLARRYAAAETPAPVRSEAEAHATCRSGSAQFLGARNVRVDDIAASSVRIFVAHATAAHGDGFRDYALLYASAASTQREARAVARGPFHTR